MSRSGSLDPPSQAHSFPGSHRGSRLPKASPLPRHLASACISTPTLNCIHFSPCTCSVIRDVCVPVLSPHLLHFSKQAKLNTANVLGPLSQWGDGGTGKEWEPDGGLEQLLGSGRGTHGGALVLQEGAGQATCGEDGGPCLRRSAQGKRAKRTFLDLREAAVGPGHIAISAWPRRVPVRKSRPQE